MCVKWIFMCNANTYHRSQFTDGSYIDSKVAYYSYCDVERLSKIELNDIAERLGGSL